MRQILAAARITPEKDRVVEDFNSYITAQTVYNDRGEKIEGAEAFTIDVASQVKLPADQRELPVFTCVTPDGATKYILPCYGAGLCA